MKLTLVTDSLVFAHLKEIGGWTLVKSVGFTDSPRVLHLTSAGVLVVEGVPPLHQGEDIWQYTVPMRVSNLLGRQPVLVLTSVVGTGQVSVGEVVTLRDHCSLVGVNPMTGHNESRWGVRFPDMRDTYSQELREQVCAVMRTNEVEVKTVNGIHTGTARLRMGPAAAAVAAAIDAHVFLRNGVHDAIIAQHRLDGEERRKVVVMGLVSSHTCTSQEQLSWSARQYQALAQVVASLST